MHGHMKNEVFLDITLSCWVCWSWYLEWSQCLKELLDPEECKNLKSHVWRLAYRLQQHNWCLLGGDYPGACKSPCGLSRKSCMTGVWHSLCYIYCLPACLHTAQPFLKRY